MFTGLAGRTNTIFLHVHCRKTLATHPKIINELPIVRNGRHPPQNPGMFSFLCVMHAMATKMNPNGSKIVFLNGIVTVKSSKTTTVRERQQRDRNQTTTKDTRRFSTPTTVHAPYQVLWEPQHTPNTSEYEQKHVTSFLQVNIKIPTSLVPMRSLD